MLRTSRSQGSLAHHHSGGGLTGREKVKSVLRGLLNRAGAAASANPAAAILGTAEADLPNLINANSTTDAGEKKGCWPLQYYME